MNAAMTRPAAATPVSFGAWLQERRKALDLTQEALARQVYCSLSAIRKIETDERKPSRPVAQRLAERLNIAPTQRELFVAVARGTAAVSRLPAPSAGLEPVRSRLPVPPTALIGREDELEALSRLLRDPACRLITLTGPGGIGKTHLALEVARREEAAFADGACFVALAALESPGLLPGAVADALGFTFQGPVDPQAQLFAYLQGKSCLLLLDNAEHLMEGVDRFARILDRAPGVKLLVTSREHLQLHAEWVYELGGLRVPPPAVAFATQDYSAVALFVANACREHAGFELTDAQQQVAARICRMLEGLPLGIELAAGWVGVLGCEEIVREMERGLDFLTSTKRDVPPWHLGLRAVFDRSWNMLGAPERDVLRRLTLFRNSFTRAAAEHVAGANPAVLASLVAKSMVQRLASGRYHLHPVIREFASAHLSNDAPEAAATQARFSEFFLRLLRESETELYGAGQQRAIGELTKEIDNIRTAWVGAIELQQFAPLQQAIRSYWLLCDMRGWSHGCADQAESLVQAVRRRPDAPDHAEVLGHALALEGAVYWRLGQHQLARELLEESFALLRDTCDSATFRTSRVLYAVVMAHLGDLATARVTIDEALARAEAAGDTWNRALGLLIQGRVAHLSGDFSAAFASMQGSLALWRSLADRRFTCLALNLLGGVAVPLGRYEEARSYLEESLALTTQMGDRWGMGTAYRNLAAVVLAQGEVAEARSLLHKSLEFFRELDLRWDIARSLVLLGDAAAATNALDAARKQYAEAIRLAEASQLRPITLDAMLSLARLNARAGDIARAAELARTVGDHPASTGEAKEASARLRAELQAGGASDIRTEAGVSEPRSCETLISEILAYSESQTKPKGRPKPRTKPKP